MAKKKNKSPFLAALIAEPMSMPRGRHMMPDETEMDEATPKKKGRGKKSKTKRKLAGDNMVSGWAGY